MFGCFMAEVFQVLSEGEPQSKLPPSLLFLGRNTGVAWPASVLVTPQTSCWIMPWLTVLGSAPRLCGSRTHRAVRRCWGAGVPAGWPLPSRSPLSLHLVCWPDSGASWWTWLHIRCPCSSRCSAWLSQTAHCGHKRHKKTLTVLVSMADDTIICVNLCCLFQIENNFWKNAKQLTTGYSNRWGRWPERMPCVKTSWNIVQSSSLPVSQPDKEQSDKQAVWTELLSSHNIPAKFQAIHKWTVQREKKKFPERCIFLNRGVAWRPSVSGGLFHFSPCWLWLHR